MKREEFIETSGAVYESDRAFESWHAKDKKRNFWAFFEDNGFIKVSNAYTSTTTIEDLIENGTIGIAHIVPLRFLRKWLRERIGTRLDVINGATTNPFNMIPAHLNNLNNSLTTGVNFPFDYEDEKLVDHGLIFNPIFSDYGFDGQKEWFIPSATRGQIARSVLYMSLLYSFKVFYPEDVDVLVKCARADPPSETEKQYNEYVSARKGINNPFISTPELINDGELLKELLYPGKNTITTELVEVTRGTVLSQHGKLRISKVVPIPADNSGEYIEVQNLSGKKNIELDTQWKVRVYSLTGVFQKEAPIVSTLALSPHAKHKIELPQGTLPVGGGIITLQTGNSIAVMVQIPHAKKGLKIKIAI